MATAPTTELDNTDEHSTTALYRAAIGSISNDYYLTRFTRFDAADRPGLSWNWAAALSTLNWLMFRQLWHAALVYSGSIVALALLLFGIGRLVFQFSAGAQWGLLAVVVGLAFVLPGLGGNALYYLASRQRVQNALAKNQTVHEACAHLSKQASSRKSLAIIAACNVVLLALAAQSYAMFSGFEPLPAGTPVAVGPAPESRHIASGKAVDASVVEAAKPMPPAASAPAAAASMAVPPAASRASATVPTSASSATAPLPQTAGSAASAPIAKPAASSPAAAPVRAAPASSAQAPAKPVGPTPIALRSTASEAAAREVAASLGQPLPSSRQVTPPAAVIAPASPATGRFVVNVGLFADPNNARNALVKLMDAELPVVSKEIRFPKGNRTRVQVGPFETLTEADAAADKVRALALEARVAPAP